MIYLYFDKTGTLKEVINDESIRRGATNVNGLAVYCELWDDADFELDDIWYCQRVSCGKLTPEVSFIDNLEIMQVPYKKDVDYKYFKDFKQYKFYVFEFTTEYTQYSGLNVGTVRFAIDDGINALGTITFNIQDNVIKEDNNITQSQYDYLLLSYASRTLNEETGRTLCQLIEDIVKEQAKISGIEFVGTTTEILALTSDEGIALSTTNAHIFNWDDEQGSYVDSGIEFMDVSLSSNVATLSGNQTFTGNKTFSGGLDVSEVGSNNTSVVNKQYADNINNSAVHKTGTEVITGNKLFYGDVVANEIIYDAQFMLFRDVDAVNEIKLSDTLKFDTYEGTSIFVNGTFIAKFFIDGGTRYLQGNQDGTYLKNFLVATPINNNDLVNKSYADGIYSLATNNIAGKDISTNILAKSSNTGIWIGTDTGHWYYWNGTQYADGGVYQDSVYNDTIKRVALPLFNINSDDVTENKYINYQWGVEGNLTGVKYVTFIVKGIEKIYYSATNNSPDNRGLAFYNQNGNFISGSGVQMIGTVQEISVPSNAYYCKATVYNISQVALKLSIFDVLNKIKDINIYKNDSVITTSDKYINYQWGIESSLSGAKFVTLNVFGAKKVIYKSINSSPDNRGLAFYNQNGNFISGSGVQMGTTAQTVNVPSNAYYCKATVINIDEVIIDTDVNALIKTISENNLATKTKSLNILHAFSNIYCIGDSLTYGQVYTSANTSRQAYVNFPNALARITGANVNYDATSGYTAIWWWQAYNNNIIQRDNQLAIVYLGSNSGLTDTIATDCVGDDYTQWADTNTGDYAKIIAKCQSVGMKVLLVKIPNNDTTTNSVIEKMAIKFNCVAIEPIYLSDDKYHYYPDGTGANSYHYNDLGYSAWAEQLVYNVGLLSNNEMKKIIPN